MCLQNNTGLLLKVPPVQVLEKDCHIRLCAQALRKTGSGCSLDENNLERLFWRENHAARTQLSYLKTLQQPLRQMCVAPGSCEVCQIARLTIEAHCHPQIWAQNSNKQVSGAMCVGVSSSPMLRRC